MILFRGISAPMTHQVLMNTVMFSTFDRTRSFASERLDGNVAAMGAGLLSGFATACLSKSRGLVQDTVPDKPVVVVRQQHDEKSAVGSEEGCRNEWQTQTFRPLIRTISRALGESL